MTKVKTSAAHQPGDVVLGSVEWPKSCHENAAQNGRTDQAENSSDSSGPSVLRFA